MIIMVIILGSCYTVAFETMVKVAYNRSFEWVPLQYVKILNERLLQMSTPSQSCLMDLNLMQRVKNICTYYVFVFIVIL